MGEFTMNSREIFLDQTKEVLNKFTKLSIVNTNNGLPMLKGELDIIDKDGKYWESYLVEIHCVDEYPNRFPLLFEVGNKIPQIGDWHVYEDTKACCIKVLQEELLICKEGITLIGFIQYQVLPYLFNQTYRRVEGFYVNGEYSHGIFGIIEFYKLQLKVSENSEVIKYLSYIQNGIEPDRVAMCFCGSKIKYRKCHRDSFRNIIKLGQVQLRKDIENIIRFTNILYSI
jgi:hypothetical protein